MLGSYQLVLRDMLLSKLEAWSKFNTFVYADKLPAECNAWPAPGNERPCQQVQNNACSCISRDTCIRLMVFEAQIASMNQPSSFPDLSLGIIESL